MDAHNGMITCMSHSNINSNTNNSNTNQWGNDLLVTGGMYIYILLKTDMSLLVISITCTCLQYLLFYITVMIYLLNYKK